MNHDDSIVEIANIPLTIVIVYNFFFLLKLWNHMSVQYTLCVCAVPFVISLQFTSETFHSNYFSSSSSFFLHFKAHEKSLQIIQNRK